MADSRNWRAPAGSLLIVGSMQRRKQCKNFDGTRQDWIDGRIVVDLLNPEYRKWPRCFYKIEYEVREGVYGSRIDRIRGVRNLMRCNVDQFVPVLELLIMADELDHAIRMRKHDIQNRKLVPERDENGVLIKFGFEMPNLACKSPPIVKGDYVVIDHGQGRPLAVLVVNSGKNYIELPKEAYEFYGRHLPRFVNVSFVPQGRQFKTQQAAVEELTESETVQRLLFEEIGEPNLDEVKIDVAQTSTEELDERLQALNCRQREAVMGILEARCRPKPYVLLAPTGTGVTATLVEAVVQVHKRTHKQAAEADSWGNEGQSALGDVSNLSNLKVRILVCSNSTYAISWWHRNIKAQLPDARVSLLSANRYLDANDQIEIVCATHSKSSSLMGVPKFDYIFVDEANQKSVAESLVQASLLKPDGCLVLAGDPHKLRPEVGCKQASELGLGQSHMARLLEFRIYQRDQQTGGYDSRLITMLRECYYGDARIMSICNRLFYNNELSLPSQETPRGLLEVLRLTGPLQFRHVAGEEVADLDQDSMFNQAEVDVCVDLVKRLYCMGILPDRIGVTSPYRLQVDKIRRALESLNDEIKPTLCDRFDQYKLRPIRWMLNEGVEPSQASIGQYVQAEGSRLYKRIGEGTFVECDLETLPDDLTSLFVRQDSVGNKLDCQTATNGALRDDKKGIMIISTVLTRGEGDSLRDLCDPRRFNVNITRAKWLVIVVGNREVLERAEYWRELLANAETDLDAWPENVDCTDPFSQRPLFHAR